MSARLALLRVAFGAGELLAPGTAARCAARMWFTVPRRRASPLPPGASAGATEFAVDLPTGVVRGRTWGDGPAVYFMHGWGGGSDQVHPYVEPLVRHGLRVVTLDAPGHGVSARRRRTHVVEFAHALEAVQRAHGPTHAVIAHSLGAVALMVALRTGRMAPPHRVVLLAPLAQVDGQLDRLARLIGLGQRTRAALEHEVAATTGLAVDQLALAGLAASYPGADTVVVHDRDDTFAAYDETAALVSRWPGARLVTTRGLGHVRLLSDADVVATVVASVTGQATSATPCDHPGPHAGPVVSSSGSTGPPWRRADHSTPTVSRRMGLTVATWPETLGF